MMRDELGTLFTDDDFAALSRHADNLPKPRGGWHWSPLRHTPKMAQIARRPRPCTAVLIGSMLQVWSSLTPASTALS
jgi:hypothetical protein